MSDTPPLVGDALFIGKTMLHDRAVRGPFYLLVFAARDLKSFTLQGFEKCANCARFNYDCVFDGWGFHCGECVLFGHQMCTYIHYGSMDESIEHRNTAIRLSRGASLTRLSTQTRANPRLFSG